MKKLFVIISILSFLSLPVTAQGPEPVYLPLVLGGHDMPCGPFQVLEISDGTTTVNLLSPKSGFALLEWEPSLAQPKGGGVWRDSTLAEGRQLGIRMRSNVVDTLTLAVRDWTPDDLIRDTQDLRRLLEKAYQYDTVSWQDEPVWIKRHPVNATNAEYTIIKDYRTPQDGNPHGSDTFWTGLARAGFPEFTLILEHEGFWRADQPGTGTCVQISGQQEDWEYETWTVNTNQPVNEVHSIIDTSCGQLLASDVNPGSSVWRSANGTAWALGAVTPNMDVWGLLEADDGYIYAAGVDAGNPEIWRSNDCGDNWGVVPVASPPGTDHNNSLIQGSDGYIYLASVMTGANSGIWRSANGVAWNQVFNDAIVEFSWFVYEDSNAVLWSSMQTILLRSTDGTTWTRQWQDPLGGQLLTMIEVNGRLLLGTGGGRVYYSSVDDTLTWHRSSTRLWSGIYAFEIYNERVYAGLGDGTIWVSIDDGVTWNLLIDFGASPVESLRSYSGNDRLYAGEDGEIYWNPDTADMGRSGTCNDEVYVANKRNVAQLTHVKVYDASAAPPADYTDQLPAGAFPYDLLPDPFVAGDMLYIGIDSTILDSGPFCSVVFDIDDALIVTGTSTIRWEYSQGGAAWNTLNVQDNTAATYPFQRAGVNSLHWVPPSDWATDTVNTVTAYWIRLNVVALATHIQTPTQANRDLYTVNWPRIDIDELQVTGDIPALMQFRLRNRSDEDGYESTLDELDLLENRVIVGLRSLDRGSTFTAYLNCSDEQNPLGVTTTDGDSTLYVDDVDHPTGRSMEHDTTGTSTWTDECTFTLGPTVARDFYGSFHAYLRAQEEDWDTEIGEVRVRLQVRTGSGGVMFTTDHVQFRNLNDWQLLDLGGVDIPASGLLSSSDLGDETELVIQVWSSVAALTVNLYDLILIPTDEWAMDAVDKAMEDDSGVGNGYLLDADSVTYPKRDVRALVRQAGSDYIRSVYQPNTPGPAILQANADQRLWFLTARGVVTGSHTGANNATTLTDSAASFLTSGVEAGQIIYNITDGSSGAVGSTVTATTISDCGLADGTDDNWDTNDEYLIICPNWRSEPWNAHSVQVWAVARYLSMRGSR